MATTIQERQLAPTHEHNGATPATAATPVEWGNSAPLALAGFAVTTFMLSMINANFISAGVEPAVFGVALMFGGITQLLAGLIQLRTGNTFAGVLFSRIRRVLAVAVRDRRVLPEGDTGQSGRARARAVPLRVRVLRHLDDARVVPHQRNRGDGAGAAHRRLLHAWRGQLRGAHRPRAHRRVPGPGCRRAGPVSLLRGDL